MPLDASALTTLPHLKTALQITTTTNDDYLTDLINRATSWIESRCDRKLKARRYNGDTGTAPNNVHTTTLIRDSDYLFFNGSLTKDGGDTEVDERGYGLLYLPAYPVQANATVTFVLAPLTDRASTISGGETWDTTDLVEWDDYVVDRTRGIVRLLNGRFTSGFRNYRVTMAAGYQVGDNQPYVDPDLEDLCIQVAKKLYKESDGVQSESIGTWSRSYNAEKQDSLIDATLAKYRRISL